MTGLFVRKKVFLSIPLLVHHFILYIFGGLKYLFLLC